MSHTDAYLHSARVSTINPGRLVPHAYTGTTREETAAQKTQMGSWSVALVRRDRPSETTSGYPSRVGSSRTLPAFQWWHPLRVQASPGAGTMGLFQGCTSTHMNSARYCTCHIYKSLQCTSTTKGNMRINRRSLITTCANPDRQGNGIPRSALLAQRNKYANRGMALQRTGESERDRELFSFETHRFSNFAEPCPLAEFVLAVCLCERQVCHLFDVSTGCPKIRRQSTVNRQRNSIRFGL